MLEHEKGKDARTCANPQPRANSDNGLRISAIEQARLCYLTNASHNLRGALFVMSNDNWMVGKQWDEFREPASNPARQGKNTAVH